MSTAEPPLRIRLPETMKAKVQARGAENRRSMNAEIGRRLEWALEAEHDQNGSHATRKYLHIGLSHEVTNADRIAEFEQRLARPEKGAKSK
ncbi:Arc family DNA-binding protein [Mesorhizobium sp. M0478]|uniref:Arc family DNA-binding protein n=1 Tax=Mesorhizobium sp. M0478 TaxID=2956947 RepID=UPI003338DEA1